jgi:hypothetical protein
MSDRVVTDWPSADARRRCDVPDPHSGDDHRMALPHLWVDGEDLESDRR